MVGGGIRVELAVPAAAQVRGRVPAQGVAVLVDAQDGAPEHERRQGSLVAGAGVAPQRRGLAEHDLVVRVAVRPQPPRRGLEQSPVVVAGDGGPLAALALPLRLEPTALIRLVPHGPAVDARQQGAGPVPVRARVAAGQRDGEALELARVGLADLGRPRVDVAVGRPERRRPGGRDDDVDPARFGAADQVVDASPLVSVVGRRVGGVERRPAAVVGTRGDQSPADHVVDRVDAEVTQVVQRSLPQILVPSGQSGVVPQDRLLLVSRERRRAEQNRPTGTQDQTRGYGAGAGHSVLLTPAASWPSAPASASPGAGRQRASCAPCPRRS